MSYNNGNDILSDTQKIVRKFRDLERTTKAQNIYQKRIGNKYAIIIFAENIRDYIVCISGKRSSNNGEGDLDDFLLDMDEFIKELRVKCKMKAKVTRRRVEGIIHACNVLIGQVKNDVSNINSCNKEFSNAVNIAINIWGNRIS